MITFDMQNILLSTTLKNNFLSVSLGLPTRLKGQQEKQRGRMFYSPLGQAYALRDYHSPLLGDLSLIPRAVGSGQAI